MTGTPNAVRSVYIKHKSGGTAKIQFWSYSQGQHALMGDSVDWFHIDEEPKDPDIFPQVLTRTATGDRGNGGRGILTFTPENGRTDLVIGFMDTPSAAQTCMNVGWDDAPHLSEKVKTELLASFPAHQRDMRTKGIPMLGHGRIYDLADDAIMCQPFPCPDHFFVNQVVILPHTRLFGNGRSSRIVRRTVNGLDLLYGVNSNTLWDSTDPDVTDFAHDVEIHSLLLDGGVDGAQVPFATGKSGSGVAIWGHDIRLYNLDIFNCAEHGMRTQGTDTNVDFTNTWQESSFYSLRIRNCGAHGWMFFGPHDSKCTDISIINASQRGDNLYDGMITGDKGTGDFSGIHISVSGNNTNNYESLRSRYSLNLNTSCRFGGGSSFEGSRIPVRMAGSESQFDASCLYYASWGIGNDCIAIKMEGSCRLNQVRGRIIGSSVFRPGTNQFGVAFGYASGDSVNNNTIDLQVDGCNIPISFGSSTTTPDGDKGGNTIRIKSYYGGSKTPMGTYGVPYTESGTTIDFEMTGSATLYQRSTTQIFSSGMTAGSEVTWTFKYPFPSAPAIVPGILLPLATPTGGVWVKEITNKYAKFYNGCGVGVTLNATAERASIG
ncbi:terminase family protein [Pantoea agglomerans]|uniref:terminase large subunit domain-containing protein n=1 Tax=Enterobacter agglomerans TaxID=549 RepID=UPI001FCF28D9|nr:terminase family protein [Pantoea agglomerans]WVL91306.1 terminase family protein [Pantoea agglomerans]